jgi:acyl-CoA thioester hydrolase
MTTPPLPSSYSYEQLRRVEAEDLDEREHVNNVAYVRWIQDVAIAHWQALASKEVQSVLAWVALRHEIDYLSPGILGDEVIVRTRVGHAEGLTFERHTEVVRTHDQRLLARSRTLWCPIDARTGRPRRVSAEVRAQFSVRDGSPEQAG